ncbi:MAG: type I DNA topoisomerase [Candidatus Saccharimonadales bacterium]|nr:type I DNA topoisomerase [Candidatus Saccharimonadales bacterium]
MPKNLVIVESPAKAKTIESFLGKDFAVKSSFGHIRDLPRKKMSIDIENGFKPDYEIPDDKKKVVSDLKKAAKGASTVWLATDHDREGEAIAWHLKEALGLKKSQVKRITFTEITKTAVQEAIEDPHQVDEQLFHAQQARRVLDRLVGYELSPVLWKKVQRGLSAGRVQSVAVRLIVEREREIEAYESSSDYKLTAELSNKAGHSFSADGESRPDSKAKAKQILEKLSKSALTVASVEAKPGKRSPSAPFTTSSLQQEASNRLGFSVRRTMQLAQRLYESGKITYMRTDSMNLSGQAINQAQKVITKQFGEQYSQVRAYKTKSSSAQEAHEAIRPSNLAIQEAGADAPQKKLYKLIWQRTMASQMADAKVEKTKAVINASDTEEKLVANGEVIDFDGFLAVYPKRQENEALPPLQPGETVKLASAKATQTYSRPPHRFTEARLVRKLEELGIGRPSTYAPTISTIQDREYVKKGDSEGDDREIHVILLKQGKVTETTEVEKAGANKGRLIPTDVGRIVTDFLVKYFKKILNYDFTAHIEEDFDKIAEGKEDWHKMIASFYKEFHPLIKKTEKVTRSEASQARKIGTDPKSKKPVFARLGRYGPMLQIGESNNGDDEKPLFAPMPEGAGINDVTLKQALKMFELPKELGKTDEGELIIVQNGRFGPYLKVGDKNISLKGEDPYKMTKAKALTAIKDNAKAEKNRNINEFDDGIKVLNGRYGPYVTDGKTNAPVPKDKDPAKITNAEAKKLIADREKRQKTK